MSHGTHPDGRTLAEQERIERLRRELGHDLASKRKDAGLHQDEFARRIGCGRSSVSNAETGNRDKSREFWEACDKELRTDGAFAQEWDRIYTAGAARAARPGPGQHVTLSAAISSDRAADALAGYTQLGWPVGTAPGGGLELATGRFADAFEVTREVGVIAARSWLETAGREDLVRGIPALPAPQSHLAVISAGGRWYFLAEAGASPWSARVLEQRDASVIWHADGSTIPVPPSSVPREVTWAYLPDRTRLSLAPPLAVLHLLGHAVSLLGGSSTLALPGGATVAPAVCPAPA